MHSKLLHNCLDVYIPYIQSYLLKVDRARPGLFLLLLQINLNVARNEHFNTCKNELMNSEVADNFRYLYQVSDTILEGNEIDVDGGTFMGLLL